MDALVSREIKEAMYPCPCRYFQAGEKTCTCLPSVMARYQKRILGPLLDHIDIHVDVARVNYEKLSGTRQGEPSTFTDVAAVYRAIRNLYCRM